MKNPVLLYKRLNVKGEACLPRYTLCEVWGAAIQTHLPCKEWEGAAELIVSTADALKQYPCISCSSFKGERVCWGGRLEEISSSSIKGQMRES